MTRYYTVFLKFQNGQAMDLSDRFHKLRLHTLEFTQGDDIPSFTDVEITFSKTNPLTDKEQQIVIDQLLRQAACGDNSATFEMTISSVDTEFGYDYHGCAFSDVSGVLERISIRAGDITEERFHSDE